MIVVITRCQSCSRQDHNGTDDIVNAGDDGGDCADDDGDGDGESQ